MELLDEKVQLWLESPGFVKAKPGVYVFYDKQFEVIYIGASENLRKEFAKYVNTNFENNTCKQKTHTYQRTFTENPKERKPNSWKNIRKNMETFPVAMMRLVEKLKK